MFKKSKLNYGWKLLLKIFRDLRPRRMKLISLFGFFGFEGVDYKAEANEIVTSEV
jgi:hypothetical protein